VVAWRITLRKPSRTRPLQRQSPWSPPRRGEVEARLADPATYSGPPTVAADLQKEKTRLKREIAHAEHDWLVAQEAFEAA
jgi:hypothetical protein